MAWTKRQIWGDKCRCWCCGCINGEEQGRIWSDYCGYQQWCSDGKQLSSVAVPFYLVPENTESFTIELRFTFDQHLEWQCQYCETDWLFGLSSSFQVRNEELKSNLHLPQSKLPKRKRYFPYRYQSFTRSKCMVIGQGIVAEAGSSSTIIIPLTCRQKEEKKEEMIW